MDRILRILGVQEQETRVAGGLFFFSFVLGVARVFILTASQAIFLENYPASDLAYVYMLAAVATMATSAVYLYVGRRLTLRPQILANLVFALLATVAIWIFLGWSDARWPAMALAVWFHVLFALTSVAFWGAATQVVDIRQGKRLFPLVTMGDVLAFFLGGFFILRVVGTIGAPNLLIIGAAGLALAAFSFVRLCRVRPERFRGGGRPAEGARAPERVTWSSPYLLLMMAYFILSAMVFVFVDNAFNDVAQQRYSDTAQLARFFATYSAVAAIVSFFFRTFGAGRMIQKFGLIAGLIGLPAAVLVGSTVVAGAGYLLPAVGLVFWLTTMTRLFDQVFRGIQTSSLATLYQPLMERGPAIQTTMDGIIDSAAIGISGVALLVLHFFFDIGAPELAVMLFVFCAIWIVVTLGLRNEYVTILGTVLHRRRIKGESLEIVDDNVLSLVQEELASTHPENVLYAVHLLEEAEHPGLQQVLTDLVHHESEDVQAEILRRIERHGVVAALDAVRKIAEDSGVSDALRGEAIRVLGSMMDEIDPAVMEALREGSPDEKRGALVGLLRSGSIEGVVYAGAELLEELNSHSPVSRVFAAHVLRDAAIPSFYRQAIQLLNDPSPQVRAAAVEAAAAMAHPPLWPIVVDALLDRQLAAAASEALIAAGEGAVPSLVKGFERHVWDRHFRLQVLRILGLIRGEEVIRHIFPLTGLSDREEREAAFTALVSCGFRPDVDQRELLTERLRHETREAAELFMAAENLDGPAEALLLQAALTEEIERVRHRIFLLLSLLYPEGDAMTTWDNYSSGIREREAYALEVVENFITNEERAWLFPVLEDLGTSDRLERLGREWGVAPKGFTPQLTSILEEKALSDWTLLCARQLASVVNIGDVTLSDEDARVYERTVRLRSVDLFAELSDHTLAALASRLQEVNVDEGEAVFSKGDVGDSMYLITGGRVRIHDGPTELAQVGEDHVFGEFTVLHSGPRTASVTACEPTQMLCFTQGDLYELIADQVSVARALIQMIVQRLHENVETRGSSWPDHFPVR